MAFLLSNCATATVDSDTTHEKKAPSSKLKQKSSENKHIYECRDGSFQTEQALCQPTPIPLLVKFCSDGRPVGYPYDCRTQAEINMEDATVACAVNDLVFDPITRSCVPN